MRSQKLFVGAVVASLFPMVLAQASTIQSIPGLSNAAKSSLVAYYNGDTGVATSGTTVDSWTPVDVDGNPLPGLVINSTQRGAGAADLISYNSGSGTLFFDDTAQGADGRYLAGNLNNSGTADFTIVWKGHYDAGAPFATSGTYAYNIGPNDISHQRDDSGTGFRVEMYNGTTYTGDDIDVYDGIDTIWSTVITANSHAAYANGTNLNITGSPTNFVDGNASIVVGAFSGSGFDMVGDISDIIIFESALSPSDLQAVEGYLAIPEPASLLLIAAAAPLAWYLRRR